MHPVVRWILRLSGALLVLAAQVGPNALKSNISEWLRWLGLTEIPRWLLTPKIDPILTLLGIGLLLFSFGAWIYRQLRGMFRPLRVEHFCASDPTDLKYTVGVNVTNCTSARLHHCTVRIENIEPSDPDALYWIFSDSQLRLKPAEEDVFALNPGDHREIPIAQYDSVNRFEKLGIELLCFSKQKHQAVDPRQSYTFTVRVSADKGTPMQKRYKLYLDGVGRLCFDPVLKPALFAKIKKGIRNTLVVRQGVKEAQPRNIIEKEPYDGRIGQISISPILGTGNQSFCATFENTTARPIKGCKYYLSNLQRWSEIQRTYLIRSKSWEPVYISGPRTLEPESPEGFEMFSNRGNYLFFMGSRNGKHDSFTEQAGANTTWRIVVSVSADDKVINERPVYFKIIGANR